MNLNWLKQNLVLVVVSAVFLGLVGFVVVLERKASAQNDDVDLELQSQTQSLTGLRQQKPYPSPENIEITRRGRDTLQKLYDALQDAVRRDRMDTPRPGRDIEFSQLMRRTLAELAVSATNAGVRLPDNFAFGFTRYIADFPCRNPPAKPDDCKVLLAVLAKQLAVVEKISLIAITNGVHDISRIRRTEAEPGGASADALPVPITTDPKGMYQTLPFEFSFTCDARALQAFLNNLSRSDWFFAVRSVQITGEAPATGPAATDAAGQKKEQRFLSVTARIDLIEFPSPPAKPST